MATLVLMHRGGDTKVVEVVRAFRKGRVKKTNLECLDIRWELAGIYTLDLQANILLDKSRQWSAQDIKKAWEIYKRLVTPKLGDQLGIESDLPIGFKPKPVASGDWQFGKKVG